MKIILANPRGFCAGVNMAIESLERALDFFGPPLYVYHEIVHNKFVVERFRERGTVFVESLDEVPPGSPLLYSAHGVSPQIREQARSAGCSPSTPPARSSPRSTSRPSSTPAKATRSS